MLGLLEEETIKLFIACLLIYHYQMEWYWFAFASALWIVTLGTKAVWVGGGFAHTTRMLYDRFPRTHFRGQPLK